MKTKNNINLEKLILESGFTKTFIAQSLNIDPSEISRAITLKRKNSIKYKERIIHFLLSVDYSHHQKRLQKIIK